MVLEEIRGVKQKSDNFSAMVVGTILLVTVPRVTAPSIFSGEHVELCMYAIS